MELLPDHETLILWLTQYGSLVIFFFLALGIIALPVPEESLLVLAGVLVSNHQLQLIPTLLAGYGGSLCGITGSYLIGRLAGNYLIQRYGKWIGLTETRIKQAHYWFERFGKWTLVIGYFIPGIRHFTGFTAGLTTLNFSSFALYAYSGAFLWVTTFLSIGYFFGPYWLSLWLTLFENIEINLDWMLGIGLIVVIGLILYKLKKHRSNQQPR